jgi:hypothetical protein
MKKILLLFFLISFGNFLMSQNILSSFPKLIKDRSESIITVKCYNVDFKKNKYEFYFSNNNGMGFVTIKKIEFTCNDIAKITIHTNNYFNSSYDLTIKDLNSNITNTLQNALQTYSTGNPTLESISKKSAKKGDKLTVKFSGLNTNFKSGQASKTTISFTHFNQGSSSINSASSTIFATSFNVNSETDLDANFSIPLNAYSGIYIPTVENYLDGELSIYDISKAFYIESQNQAKIISVNKLNSGSNTLVFEVNVNPEHNLYTALNKQVNIKINNEFYSASTTVINANKMKCEVYVYNTNSLYNGSYPLYYFYNNSEYAIYENALVINNNPKPTLTNLPLKVIAGLNNKITLNGINMKFNEFSSTMNVYFEQGSSTSIQVPKSNNSSSVTFDLYVPKNTKTGNYSFDINKNIDNYGIIYGEFIEYFENGIEVINNNMPSITIENTTPFITGKDIIFNIKSNNLNISSDIKNAYVYFDENEQPTPIIISNRTSNTASLSCFVSPFTKSGSYKVYFETFKDGLLESTNLLNIKGTTPGITKIEPNVSYPGVTSEFILTLENMNVNPQSISGLYFEFEEACEPIYKILNTTNETVRLSVSIPSNLAYGKYKILINNPTTKIESNALLEIKDVKSASIENLVDNNITIYPNPVKNGEINILYAGEPFQGDFKLFDTQGKAIDLNDFKNNTKSGLYFIELNIDNQTYTRKIIVD